MVLGIVSLDFCLKHANSILQCFPTHFVKHVVNLCFSAAESNKSVYLLDNCPHDWLFPRCTAVVPTELFLVEALFFYLE